MNVTSVSWNELPLSVRAAVEAHTGPVLDAATTGEGFGSDLAAMLSTAAGRVACRPVIPARAGAPPSGKRGSASKHSGEAQNER